MTDPYAIYELNDDNEINKLITNVNEENFNSVFKYIKLHGNRLSSVKLKSLGKCDELFRTSDGLYSLCKSLKANSLYIVMYIDYTELENALTNKKGVN